MNDAKKNKTKIWITITLALLIVVLAVLAFLPTMLKQSHTEATSVGSEVDEEAMRVLGCCNAYLAESGFKTTMNGTVKASVVGVPYTQKVHGGRTIDGANDIYTDVAESTSALVKAAIKRERRNGVYYVSRGSYKNKSFSYGNEQELSKTSYIAQYGQPFTGVVKYNLENTVVCAEKISDGKYRFVLDPIHATVYSRNEVKTTLGGKSYPEYKSVEFTLTTDGDKPVKVTTTEKFKIDKFGGTNCTAQYTEMFSFNSEL